MSERIRRILQKLSEAKRRGLSCFGSESHRFQLNTPLSPSSLEMFEQRQKVRLPEDYRAFLLEAGDGGAGPYYGIYSLDKWADFVTWVSDDPPDGCLARPCPLTPALPRTPDWKATLGGVFPYQGTLSLGTQGCSYAMQLIVSGAFRGRVVYVDADGGPPYVVRESDFLGWYERWLDELLQGYEMFWFGYGPGGSEESLFGIYEGQASSDALRIEAAQSLRRLPTLSQQGKPRIEQLLADRLTEVRAVACGIVGKFKLMDFLGQTESLLGDRDPLVRRASLRALLDAAPDRWRVVHPRLFDEDEDVAQSAFFALQRLTRITRDDLLGLVQNSPHEGVRHYAAHAVEWEQQDVPLLNHLLHDDNSQVRFYATLGLRKLKASDAEQDILSLLDRETEALVIGSCLRFLSDCHSAAAADCLLAWAKSADDFHRLDAIEGLIRRGDERAAPLVLAMLKENRSPVRRDPRGGGISDVHTIGQLVRKLLQTASPEFRLLME